MASELHPILRPGGALITSRPASDLEPGELVEARDVAHRYWGPRQARRRLSQPSGVFGRRHPTFDGVDDYLQFPYLAEQMTLPRNFTLDLLFNPTDYAVGDTTIFAMDEDTTNMAMWVALDGSGGASPGIVKAYMRDTAGNTVSLTGATQLDVGSSYLAQHSIRITRNGATVKLYVNGVLEDTDTGFNATNGVVATSGEGILIGRKHAAAAANTYFVGHIWKAHLYGGVNSDLRSCRHDVLFTRSPHTFFCYQGGPDTNGGTTFLELSRFGNHGVSSGTPAAASGGPADGSLQPAQVITYFRDRSKRTYNAVMAQGALYVDRMG